jgi:hypothetical protein
MAAVKQIQHITHYMVGSTRNILLGLGLGYALEHKAYSHVPLIFIFPSIYAGYQTYVNRDAILSRIYSASNPPATPETCKSRELSKTDAFFRGE